MKRVIDFSGKHLTVNMEESGRWQIYCNIRGFPLKPTEKDDGKRIGNHIGDALSELQEDIINFIAYCDEMKRRETKQ